MYNEFNVNVNWNNLPFEYSLDESFKFSWSFNINSFNNLAQSKCVNRLIIII